MFVWAQLTQYYERLDLGIYIAQLAQYYNRLNTRLCYKQTELNVIMDPIQG